MKLHIVVMPQRGLFQGFGTQGPDWKKQKQKLCYGPWIPPTVTAVRLEPASAPGITLTSEDDYSTRQQWGRLLALQSLVQVRWTAELMQPFFS